MGSNAVTVDGDCVVAIRSVYGIYLCRWIRKLDI